MPRGQTYPDALVIRTMEEHYILHGFARVRDAAQEIGMHRVHLSQRLTKMAKEGIITPEQLEEWRNPAARSQANGASSIRLSLRLSPENYNWLNQQPNSCSATINGLINMCRE